MACAGEVSAGGVTVVACGAREYGLSRPSFGDAAAAAFKKQTFKNHVNVARAGEHVPQGFEIKP